MAECGSIVVYAMQPWAGQWLARPPAGLPHKRLKYIVVCTWYVPDMFLALPKMHKQVGMRLVLPKMHEQVNDIQSVGPQGIR